MKKTRVIIMGAAGRDFHNFNVYFRGNPGYEVVCFTAAQIPDIAGRRYPKELSGRLYQEGIHIYPEELLPKLIKKYRIDQVILAYSDLQHIDVMHKASMVLANGADFRLMGPENTMLESNRKVIAVTAVRTGAGKSQTTRYIAGLLKSMGMRTVVVRHPMPYGDLIKQVCQKFENLKDLDKYNCTIEEREEYEPLIERGVTLFAGVDYKKILREAEKAAGLHGVIIWDGGNNDLPFFRPDLHVCIVDPLRPGHEISYYPGETNFRMADVIVINKQKNSRKKDIETVRKNTKLYNPSALIIDADSVISASNPELIRDKRVLVIEDGPTLTHGGMHYGAGTIAARRYNAKIINPRKHATGSMKQILKEYPHLGNILPAMGYGPSQIKELETIINKSECDAVVAGTPIDLRKVLNSKKPIVRISYELKEIGKARLEKIIGHITRPRH